jgi:hypothetical protein
MASAKKSRAKEASTATEKRKSCVFCGCDDCQISKEHAWPRWVRKAFPPGPKHVTRGDRATPVKLGFNLSDDDTGVKVKDVCKLRCNEGWMSGLERQVAPLLMQPIMDGASVTFTRDQQNILAAWCCKTAMVFEFAASYAPFFTFVERNHLRRTLAPPALTVIFLARYVSNSGARLCTAFGGGLGIDAKANGRVHHTIYAHSATMSVGQFVFQVIGFHVPDGVTAFNLPVKHNFEKESVTLWPPESAVSWPPTESLTDASFPDFVDRFGPRD